MADWNALRRRARALHRQLRLQLPPEARRTLLPTADALLQAAERETEVDRRALPAADPLLAGAYAVLDRDFPAIWYAASPDISPARQRFAQAHEFAHFYLHPELGEDHCDIEESPEAFAPPSYRVQQSQIAEGYSRKERREEEANLFAAELLLPCTTLYRLFTERRWTATRIANHSGLSLSCVQSQLACALLTGAGRDTTEEHLRDSQQIATPLPSSIGIGIGIGIGLDASQAAAARIETGPVLVDAGPGTGKTRTLIARILFLLTEQRVRPENVLALTFSNKAAEEMHTRLRAEVGDLADRVWIGTFHAFGREMLRKEGVRLGLSSSIDLIDLPDSVKLLEENVDRLQLRHFEYLNQPILPFPDILECISRAKDELISPQRFRQIAENRLALAIESQKAAQGISNRREQKSRQAEAEKLQVTAEKWLEVALVYEVYQELLQETDRLDFGDLIMRSVELLDAFPEVRTRWQRQYPHLLADEYQDINRASAQLVRRMAGEGRGLWAVGDLRQAIYRFRGASPANVREFETDYPGARKLELQRNYRSLPAIVALFGTYAGRMSGMAGDAFANWEPHRGASSAESDEAVRAEQDRLPLDPQLKLGDGGKRTVPHNEASADKPFNPPADGEKLPSVIVATADDEEAQADGMAAQIRQWEEKGVGLGEQVILCYTHQQASRLSERLSLRGIETQHLGGLFDRAEVKDLFALISLVCEPEGTALRRVARFPEYAIPDPDVLLLLEASRREQRPFPIALDLEHSLPDISPAGRQGLRKLAYHLNQLLSTIQRQRSAWSLLVTYLFEISDYLRPILAENSMAARQRLLAINELLAVALKLQSRFAMEENAPLAFLNHLRYLIACRQEKTVRMAGDEGELEGVRLMTIHRSKGLEFPVVYLPNLVKDQFPTGKVGRMVSPPTDWNDPVGGLTDPEEETHPDGKEIENLFFVALSRARDALVLSRPLSWNGKPVDMSPLLRQAEPALAACNANRAHWPRMTAPPATVPINPEVESEKNVIKEIKLELSGARADSEARSGVASEANYGSDANVKENVKESIKEDIKKEVEEEKEDIKEDIKKKVKKEEKEEVNKNILGALTLSAGTVEMYRDCPRRYYYDRVLNLPRRSDRTPYLAARTGWNETVKWLQAERSAGRTPTREEASAHMRQLYNDYSEELTGAMGRVLRQRAEEWLDIAFREVEQARSLVTGLELEAKLEHGTIRVPVDQAERADDDGLRLLDYKTRRNDREDHRNPRLALARHAARQAEPTRNVQIVLGYLQDGEQREVEETARYEPDRVKKYDEALLGIREGRFEANPNPSRCAECPFYLVCPY